MKYLHIIRHTTFCYAIHSLFYQLIYNSVGIYRSIIQYPNNIYIYYKSIVYLNILLFYYDSDTQFLSVVDGHLFHTPSNTTDYITNSTMYASTIYILRIYNICNYKDNPIIYLDTGA